MSLHDSIKSCKFYNIDNISQVDKIEYCDSNESNETLRCVSCKEFFTEPFQMPCGHRICTPCRNTLPSPLFQCPSKDPECDEDMQTSMVSEDHAMRRELRNKRVYCLQKSYGCSEVFLLKFIISHLSEKCQHIFVSCPHYCTTPPIKRMHLSEHLDTCPQQHLVCKYHQFGCTFKSDRQALHAHYIEAESDHVEMLTLRMHSMEENITGAMSTLQTNEGAMKDLQADKQILQNRLGEVKSLLSKSTTDLNIVSALQGKLKGQLEGIRDRYGEVTTTSSSSFTDGIRKQLEIQQETLLKQSDVLQQTKLRMECLECRSDNGQMLWKFDEYDHRLAKSLSYSNYAFYSQPFYTHKYGYKMCLRVYLNGEGSAKGSHISLFLVLMQGGYDDMLEWPFNMKVTMALLNQYNQKHNQRSFSPHSVHGNFTKPVSSSSSSLPSTSSSLPSTSSSLPSTSSSSQSLVNAYGWSDFISHVDMRNVGGFLVDDVVYFKVTITDTPQPEV